MENLRSNKMETFLKCYTCINARFTENCTVCLKNQNPDQDCDYEEDEDCENY